MKKAKSRTIIAMIAIIIPALLSAVNNILPSNHLTSAEQHNINYPTVVIDAGHGGIDGGATSCTGSLESHINLEIATRLNDLLHLLGVNTHMIRNSDISVYTSGTSIAEKKASDLKERVRIINQTENAFLISIHQNYFPQNQYHGAQVFYRSTEESKNFATELFFS